MVEGKRWSRQGDRVANTGRTYAVPGKRRRRLVNGIVLLPAASRGGRLADFIRDDGPAHQLLARYWAILQDLPSDHWVLLCGEGWTERTLLRALTMTLTMIGGLGLRLVTCFEQLPWRYLRKLCGANAT